jgi:Uma2 family endonuclease
MGMPNTAPPPWTREMVLALPDDGNRYELLDGELLVTPAPSAAHQWAVAAVFQRLIRYLDGTTIGFACTSPADLRLEGGQVAQPDVFVVLPRPDGSRPARWEDFGIPLLVVEVLSPSTAPADRITKRRRYQRTGIPEYWVVVVAGRVIERWRPADDRPEIIDQTLEWEPDPGHPPLAISLAELFADVPGTEGVPDGA